MTDAEFERMMNLTGGEVVRSVPGRSTVRLTLEGRVIYLKRYEPEYYSWLDRIFHHDEAEHEWKMIHRLQKAGFNVPRPVAFGRRGLRSFVATEEISGGAPADTLRPPPLAAIGQLMRRFHDAGFIHKDSYLCHIFVAGEKLYFIDLQRVLGPGKFAQRWIVKDLAALAHSAERIGLPAEEILRAYDRPDLISKVQARMRWLAQRRPKYIGVHDDPQKSKARF